MGYCSDLVKRLNYTGWLTANSAVKDAHLRQSILSVLAFDAEISGLSLAAKTPAAAEIRYEFWRIGLGKLKSGTLDFNGHPLLDSLRMADSNTINLLEESLKGRSKSTEHPHTLNDFDSLADATILPIYRAIDNILTSNCSNLAELARVQFSIRRLRGLQATLNGKRMQLNDFIPVQMQIDRVKLYEIVKLMVEHAEKSLPSPGKASKFFKIEAYCAKRWLNSVKAANFDLRAPNTLRTCTHHDGLLPLMVYAKSII